MGEVYRARDTVEAGCRTRVSSRSRFGRSRASCAVRARGAGACGAQTSAHRRDSRYRRERRHARARARTGRGRNAAGSHRPGSRAYSRGDCHRASDCGRARNGPRARIVHRDLKPANIHVSPEGSVKVLDFGLARIDGNRYWRVGRTRRFDSSMSPTMTSPAAGDGAECADGHCGLYVPGTGAGKPADKRADIWAFGVVLYEMLTGIRAFVGETVTEVAGAVIHKELDLGALPADTPQSVRLLLRRCLQKDPRQRIRDIGDVRLMLDGAFDAPVTSTKSEVVPNRSRKCLPSDQQRRWSLPCSRLPLCGP